MPRPAPRILLLALALATASGCERVEVDPSVAERPLPSTADPVDTRLAEAGATLFQRQCVACHRLEGDEVVGPNLGDVADRRESAWIRGMVLEPDSMLANDPVAAALLERYKVRMPDTGLDEARFRAVLEYLRRVAREGS